MAQHTHALRASALMLALIAQGAHAGLTVTSMSQTASATAAAQHSYTVVSPGPTCCGSSWLVGPVDEKKDTSPVGALGTLNQQVSARAEGEGMIAEAQSQGRMELVANGITMSSSGSVRHVFPDAVDVGPGAGWAIPKTTPSSDGKLGEFMFGNNTRNAVSRVQQNVAFNLSENTQVQIEWNRSKEGASYFSDFQGFNIVDANKMTVLSDFAVFRNGPSYLIELAAGNYTFQLFAYDGVTQNITGEAKLDWYSSASIRAVPEASTWAMMGLGLAGMGWVARRRSSSTAARA
jgi:PEP-CTERM motif